MSDQPRTDDQCKEQAPICETPAQLTLPPQEQVQLLDQARRSRESRTRLTGENQSPLELVDTQCKDNVVKGYTSEDGTQVLEYESGRTLSKNPDGSSILRNEDGQVLQTTDSNGAVTAFVYYGKTPYIERIINSDGSQLVRENDNDWASVAPNGKRSPISWLGEIAVDDDGKVLTTEKGTRTCDNKRDLYSWDGSN